VASFSVIFILLGLVATGVGSTLRDHHALLDKVAAAVIVALGVLFVASAFVDRLNRDWHVKALLRPAGKGGPVVAGAAFVIAWTPCVGPTLGAILSAAALTESVGHAAVLLAYYSAGLAIPFLATVGPVLVSVGVGTVSVEVVPVAVDVVPAPGRLGRPDAGSSYLGDQHNT
jgi:cytochrome c-type biogenesis protein